MIDRCRLHYCIGIVFLLAVWPGQGQAASLEDLTQAIATAAPERLPSYYVYRSRAYLARGEEAMGLADLKASLHINPTTEAYLERGEYFHKTGRLDRAIADYSAALELNPNSVKAYRLRSRAYYDSKEYTQAIIDASHIKLHDPANGFALNMIDKCFVQTSPRERIVLRSTMAEVMRARAAQGTGASTKRYRPRRAALKKKVAKAKRTTKKCGPRRRS